MGFGGYVHDQREYEREQLRRQERIQTNEVKDEQDSLNQGGIFSQEDFLEKTEEQMLLEQQQKDQQRDKYLKNKAYNDQVKAKLGKSIDAGEDNPGYVEEQMQNRFAESTFEERTKYYFEDTKYTTAKMKRYYALAADENFKLDEHAETYTNTSAKKRRDRAHDAANLFNEVRKKEESLKKELNKGKMSNLRLYWKRDEIMRIRMEAMINAAKVKATSEKNEKYRIAKAKLTCFNVLLDQAKNLQNDESKKDFAAIQRNLSKEIKNARAELEKYGYKTEEKWKDKLGLNDPELLENTQKRYNNKNIKLEDVQLLHIINSVSKEHLDPAVQQASALSEKNYGWADSQRCDSVLSMMYSIRRDKNGVPIDKEELKKVEWNKNWVAAYKDKSKEDERIKLIMESYNDLMKIPIPTPEELQKNGALYYLKKDPLRYCEMMRKIGSIDHIKKQIPFAESYLKEIGMWKEKQAAMSAFTMAIGKELRVYSSIELQNTRYVIKHGTKSKEELEEERIEAKDELDTAYEEYKKHYKLYKDQVNHNQEKSYKDALKKAEENKNTLFGKEQYEMYRQVREASRIKNCPLYNGLYGRSHQKIGSNTTLERYAGSVLRAVKFDDNWEPITDQDKEAHEWNIKFLKNVDTYLFTKEEDKKKESEKILYEMIDKEYKEFFEGQLKLPSPEELRRDIVEPLKNNQPMNSERIEELIGDIKSLYMTSLKVLSFGDVLKPLPFMKNYLAENPQMDACGDMYQPFFAQIVVYYTSAKYGINLDTGASSIDTATKMQPWFTNVAGAETWIGAYEERYNKYQNMIKEKKA